MKKIYFLLNEVKFKPYKSVAYLGFCHGEGLKQPTVSERAPVGEGALENFWKFKLKIEGFNAVFMDNVGQSGLPELP